MMSRCYNPNAKDYKWYGAVGVTVADCWKGNPEAFVKWSLENGWAKNLHIDKDIKCKAMGIYPHIYIVLIPVLGLLLKLMYQKPRIELIMANTLTSS